MDIGMDNPDAAEAMERALMLVQACRVRMDRLPRDPTELDLPGTELRRLMGDLPEPLVDPRLSILSGLTRALDSLEQIRRFCLGVPTTPTVLAVLIRTAVIAGVRPVFLFGPETFEERKTNLLRVMRQESDSFFYIYNDSQHYTELNSLVPPPELMRVQMERLRRIRQIVPNRLSDAEMLREAARLTGELIAAEDGVRTEDQVGGQAVREQLLFIFNALSGVAHGYGWPRLVPGTEDLPGDFVADFSMTASLVQLSLHLTEKACRVTEPS